MYPQGTHGFPVKEFQPFGPAVCPAIGNIYTNNFFYFINTLLFLEQSWLTELAEVNGEIYIVLHQIKGLNDKILHNLPFSREHFQVFFND